MDIFIILLVSAFGMLQANHAGYRQGYSDGRRRVAPIYPNRRKRKRRHGKSQGKWSLK